MKKVISIIALSLAIIFALFVWPTVYRYDRFGITTVRTNRFTGNTQFLTVDGWKDSHRRAPLPIPSSAPPPAQPALPEGFVLDKPAPKRDVFDEITATGGNKTDSQKQ